MANPNLMRQADGKKQKPMKGLPPALMVSLVIIVLSTAVFFAFFLISLGYETRANSVADEISEKQIELNQVKRDAAEALNFVDRLNNLSQASSQHTYWSGVLNDIADHTDKRVQVLILDGTYSEDTIDIQARAQDYDAVQRELISLNSSPLVERAVAENIQYTLDPRTKIVSVEFNMTIKLEPGVFMNEPEQIELKFNSSDEENANEEGENS